MVTSVSPKPYTENESVVTDKLTSRSGCAGLVCFGCGELLIQENLRSHGWLLMILKKDEDIMAATDGAVEQLCPIDGCPAADLVIEI